MWGTAACWRHSGCLGLGCAAARARTCWAHPFRGVVCGSPTERQGLVGALAPCLVEGPESSRLGASKGRLATPLPSPASLVPVLGTYLPCPHHCRVLLRVVCHQTTNVTTVVTATTVPVPLSLHSSDSHLSLQPSPTPITSTIGLISLYPPLPGQHTRLCYLHPIQVPKGCRACIQNIQSC